KQLVCTSILMHGTNQKCNAFQSIIGIYLKSCNTPERVVDCLHRMGLSISQDSIYNAINSLSSEATENLREMGQSLTVGYTYDNMDINFALATSSIDNLGDTLAHMTAGFVFHLDHGATPEMFACSDQLYEHSPYNPRHLIQDRPQYSFSFISQLHREDPTAAPHPLGLSRRDRFNRWKFLYTLVHDGPEYFHQFRSVLKGPELIDPIPLVKLRSAPLRMMDKSEASVSGNIDVISDILRQAGLGDVHDVANTRAQAHLVDITRYVLLFHGDLGTYERVMSVIEHRSLEATPFRRFQSPAFPDVIVFIFGLFHLKMAAADAIWRIFLRNKCGKGDPNSVLHLVSLMRPHDSNKIGSNPRFRQMHEVIMHVGAVLRLDAWREAAGSRAPYSSLDEFAALKPSLDDLEAAASSLVLSHVPHGCDTYDARHKPSAARDGVFENTALIHRYFLLYEELSDAMNTGDIGRVEVVFAPWVLLFKATGKHKYANAMIKSLSILHADYFPSDLRRIIRYNSLVNPSGRAGKFRGLDWVQEENNLKTKVIHGGTGSNFTKEHVIKESVLLDLYRNCHENMDRNFHLSSTDAHAPLNVGLSLQVACNHLKLSRPNHFQHGRACTYSIPDMMDKGAAMLAVKVIDDSEDLTLADGIHTQSVDQEDVAAED
ncbi:hypothetical protein GGF50DRAFT_44204, partial [Schizophyllum commune]